MYLGEEGVEAVDLLPLLDEGVVLRDTAQGQLLHQVDLVRVVDEAVLTRQKTQSHMKRGSANMSSPCASVVEAMRTFSEAGSCQDAP